MFIEIDGVWLKYAEHLPSGEPLVHVNLDVGRIMVPRQFLYDRRCRPWRWDWIGAPVWETDLTELPDVPPGFEWSTGSVTGLETGTWYILHKTKGEN